MEGRQTTRDNKFNLDKYKLFLKKKSTIVNKTKLDDNKKKTVNNNTLTETNESNNNINAFLSLNKISNTYSRNKNIKPFKLPYANINKKFVNTDIINYSINNISHPNLEMTMTLNGNKINSIKRKNEGSKKMLFIKEHEKSKNYLRQNTSDSNNTQANFFASTFITTEPSVKTSRSKPTFKLYEESKISYKNIYLTGINSYRSLLNSSNIDTTREIKNDVLDKKTVLPSIKYFQMKKFTPKHLSPQKINFNSKFDIYQNSVLMDNEIFHNIIKFRNKNKRKNGTINSDETEDYIENKANTQHSEKINVIYPKGKNWMSKLFDRKSKIEKTSILMNP